MYDLMNCNIMGCRRIFYTGLKEKFVVYVFISLFLFLMIFFFFFWPFEVGHVKCD